MKRIMKSMIALTTVCAVLISFTACGKTEEKKAAAGGTANTQTVAAQEKKGNDPKEKVELSIFMGDCASFAAGVQTDPVAKQIEEKTGVVMNITTNKSIGDYKQKVAALTASGDLPDMLFVENAEMYKLLTSAKALIDCSERVKTEAPNYNKNFQHAIQVMQKFKGDRDGKLYQLPFFAKDQNDPFTPLVAPYIRWDLYKKAGSPKVESWDDLLNALEAMQKQFPTNEAGKKAYAISGWFGDGEGWAEWPVNARDMIDGFAGLDAGVVDISTGKYAGDRYIWEKGPNRKMIQFFNKAKQKGLLDPDFATQKYGDWQTKVKENRVYFLTPGWEATGYPGGSDKAFLPIPLTGENKDNYFFKFITSDGQENYGITKNCKRPEKALALIDYIATEEGSFLIKNGVKGDTWDIIDGKPMYKADVVEKLTDDNFKTQRGIRKYGNFSGFADNDICSLYGIPFNIQYSPAMLKKRMNPVVQDYCNTYKVEYPGQVFEKIKVNSFDMLTVNAKPQLDDASKSILTKCAGYFHSQIPKLILAKSDAEFDAQYAKFVEELKKMGWEKVVEKEKADFTKAADDLKASLSK